jgi:hypothetical protein
MGRNLLAVDPLPLSTASEVREKFKYKVRFPLSSAHERVCAACLVARRSSRSMCFCCCCAVAHTSQDCSTYYRV